MKALMIIALVAVLAVTGFIGWAVGSSGNVPTTDQGKVCGCCTCDDCACDPCTCCTCAPCGCK